MSDVRPKQISTPNEKMDSPTTTPLRSSGNRITNSQLLAISQELQQLEIVELQLQVQKKQNETDKLRKELQPPFAPPVSSLPQAPQTCKTLAKDVELNEALELLKNSHLEFLDQDQQQASTTKSNGNEKHLSIVDFVVKPTSNTHADREVGKGLYLRTKKKLNTEDVTAPQWVAANAKILLKLIEGGLALDGIKSYLRYTVKIGNYLQISEVPSVMLLDDDHRRVQKEEPQRDWDDIDGDKRYFFLEKRQYTTKPSRKAQKDPSGRPICLKYNSNYGCTLPYCKFAHVCSSCNGDHTKQHHYTNGNNPITTSSEVPPRFRSS